MQAEVALNAKGRGCKATAEIAAQAKRIIVAEAPSTQNTIIKYGMKERIFFPKRLDPKWHGNIFDESVHSVSAAWSLYLRSSLHPFAQSLTLLNL